MLGLSTSGVKGRRTYSSHGQLANGRRGYHPGVTGPPDPAVIAAVAVLADGVRRSLFDFVRRAPGAVTREQAASAVGISRNLAAFHLDKLVSAGLLVTHTGAAVSGRVGRRPVRYAPSDTDLRLTVPGRKPELLAEVLLEAVAHERRAETAAQAAVRVGREHGHDAGAKERSVRRPGRLGPERAFALLTGLLEQLGYEPSTSEDGRIRFRSCPFYPLAARAPDVVCGVNHAYVSGLVDGLGATSVEAVLCPGAARCCVEVRPAEAGGSMS
jgi:predicted ArsR family transcriptional regulator